MSFTLLPIGYCRFMAKRKRICICFSFFLVSAAVSLLFFKAYTDWTAVLFVIGASLVLSCILLYPHFAHGKLLQSKVEFSTNSIRVLDNRRHCWREIPYDAISGITVELVAGFLYGRNNEGWISKYICVYLNGLKIRPQVDFCNLFSLPDFFMMNCQEDALKMLASKKVWDDPLSSGNVDKTGTSEELA